MIEILSQKRMAYFSIDFMIFVFIFSVYIQFNHTIGTLSPKMDVKYTWH